MKPLNFFIILKKKTKRNIEGLNNEHLLASTESKWRNKDSFVLFGIYIVHKSLNIDLFYLKTLDYYTSRRNFLAKYIFSCFNIDLVVMLEHCTHVLQPFDLTGVSPLKPQLKLFSK